MNTLGDVQYIGGRGLMYVVDTMSTSGDTMSTLGDIVSTPGGYREYIGDVQYIGFSIEIENFLPTCSPTCIMISPRCTEHPLMYS